MSSLRKIRNRIRTNQFTNQTSGICPELLQVNIVILPEEYAEDFLAFASLNKKSCPVLDVTEPGEYSFNKIAPNCDIRYDIPKYNVFLNGELVDEPNSIEEYWDEDFRGFAIGCSFTFEKAILDYGIELRHIKENKNVAMYDTSIKCNPYGKFLGNTVVSMRPIKKGDVEAIVKITSKYSSVHGGPVHIGDPSSIGIKDLTSPDYGDYVKVKEGEVPVFWACGVTPQNVIKRMKPKIFITHAPGHMLITDILTDDLREDDGY